jgi:hypothetical protein
MVRLCPARGQEPISLRHASDENPEADRRNSNAVGFVVRDRFWFAASAALQKTEVGSDKRSLERHT